MVHFSGMSYRRTGCLVRPLLDVMREDQREHTAPPHPETYSKFRPAVVEWMFEVRCYPLLVVPRLTFSGR